MQNLFELLLGADYFVTQQAFRFIYECVMQVILKLCDVHFVEEALDYFASRVLANHLNHLSVAISPAKTAICHMLHLILFFLVLVGVARDDDALQDVRDQLLKLIFSCLIGRLLYLREIRIRWVGIIVLVVAIIWHVIGSFEHGSPGLITVERVAVAVDTVAFFLVWIILNFLVVGGDLVTWVDLPWARVGLQAANVDLTLPW